MHNKKTVLIIGTLCLSLLVSGCTRKKENTSTQIVSSEKSVESNERISQNVSELLDNLDDLPLYENCQTINKEENKGLKFKSATDEVTPFDEWKNKPSYASEGENLCDLSSFVKDEVLYTKNIIIESVREYNTWVGYARDYKLFVSYDNLINELECIFVCDE